MAKKPTIRQLEETVNMLTRQLNFALRMLDSIGVPFTNYVKFKGDDTSFKEYLENNEKLHKLTKEEKNDREKGNFKKTDNVSAEKVRKEKDEKK